MMRSLRSLLFLSVMCNGFYLEGIAEEEESLYFEVEEIEEGALTMRVVVNNEIWYQDKELTIRDIGDGRVECHRNTEFEDQEYETSDLTTLLHTVQASKNVKILQSSEEGAAPSPITPPRETLTACSQYLEKKASSKAPKSRRRLDYTSNQNLRSFSNRALFEGMLRLV